MTPDYRQLWIDSLYYSVNSNLPKAREQVFGEMVRQAAIAEVLSLIEDNDGDLDLAIWKVKQLKETSLKCQ